MILQLPAVALAKLLADATCRQTQAFTPIPSNDRSYQRRHLDALLAVPHLDLCRECRDIAASHHPDTLTQHEEHPDPMSIPGQTFNDRLQAQKEAKLAMLKRAQEKQLDPAEKERIMKERAARNAAREEREKQRAAEKAALREAEKAEKAERERKKKLADEARKKAQEELVRQQKARRDAKYAARKARLGRR